MRHENVPAPTCWSPRVQTTILSLRASPRKYKVVHEKCGLVDDVMIMTARSAWRPLSICELHSLVHECHQKQESHLRIERLHRRLDVSVVDLNVLDVCTWAPDRSSNHGRDRRPHEHPWVPQKVVFGDFVSAKPHRLSTFPSACSSRHSVQVRRLGQGSKRAVTPRRLLFTMSSSLTFGQRGQQTSI